MSANLINKWLVFIGILGILQNTAAQFVPSNTCTSDGNCNLICGTQSRSLENAVTTDGTTLRYFENPSKRTDSYKYGLIIPICGQFPSKITHDFSQSHVWQDNQAGRASESYQLGKLNSQYIHSGTYFGSDAYFLGFTDGDYCNSAYPYGRSTAVYLVCNTAYTSSSPYVSVNEVAVCQYSIAIHMREVCPNYTPANYPTLSPAQNNAASANKTSESSKINIIITTFCIIAILIVACMCRRYKQQRTLMESREERRARYRVCVDGAEVNVACEMVQVSPGGDVEVAEAQVQVVAPSEGNARRTVSRVGTLAEPRQARATNTRHHTRTISTDSIERPQEIARATSPQRSSSTSRIRSSQRAADAHSSDNSREQLAAAPVEAMDILEAQLYAPGVDPTVPLAYALRIQQPQQVEVVTVASVEARRVL